MFYKQKKLNCINFMLRFSLIQFSKITISKFIKSPFPGLQNMITKLMAFSKFIVKKSHNVCRWNT